MAKLTQAIDEKKIGQTRKRFILERTCSKLMLKYLLRKLQCICQYNETRVDIFFLFYDIIALKTIV